jgi:hypothetical protein
MLIPINCGDESLFHNIVKIGVACAKSKKKPSNKPINAIFPAKTKNMTEIYFAIL